jgi:hypothetical protein
VTFRRKGDFMADEGFTVTRREMTELAVEHWRLAGALREGAPAAARHALRKIGEFLKARGIEAQSLDGLPYDAGMRARVVERIKGYAGEGGDVIVERVMPLVILDGEVIQGAEVVVGGA